MRLQDIEGYTPITKNSIQNVKCTRIITGENSTKYNKYIQSLAKKVLMISATRTDGFKHDEVGILARLDGTYASQPILGYWDNNLQTSVIDTYNNMEYNFMLDENENQSLVFVHNHPNNSMISLDDILSLLGNNEICTIIAVGNNGEMHYGIKESINYKYFKLYMHIQNTLHGHSISYQQMYNNLLNNQDTYKLKIK